MIVSSITWIQVYLYKIRCVASRIDHEASQDSPAVVAID